MMNTVSMKMFSDYELNVVEYNEDQIIIFLFRDGSIMTCTVLDYAGVKDKLEVPIMYSPISLLFNSTVDGYYGVVNYGDSFGAVVVVDGVHKKLGSYDTLKEAAFIRDLYIIEHKIDQRLNFDHGEKQ